MREVLLLSAIALSTLAANANEWDEWGNLTKNDLAYLRNVYVQYPDWLKLKVKDFYDSGRTQKDYDKLKDFEDAWRISQSNGNFAEHNYSFAEKNMGPEAMAKILGNIGY